MKFEHLSHFFFIFFLTFSEEAFASDLEILKFNNRSRKKTKEKRHKTFIIYFAGILKVYGERERGDRETK